MTRQRTLIGLVVAALVCAMLWAAQPEVRADSGCSKPEGCPESSDLGYPYLTHGSTGVNVRVLQYLLADWGYDPGVIDGFWGNSTSYALSAFQRDTFGSVDGIVGKDTWGRLTRNVVNGTSGNRARAVELLVDKHANGVNDQFNAYNNGYINTGDRDLIKGYQQHLRSTGIDTGVRTDGVVDDRTWKHMLRHYERPYRYGLCPAKSWSQLEPYGTAETAHALERAAASTQADLGTINGRSDSDDLSFNDLSLEHGGDTTWHSSHEHGMDVDIRPMRTDGKQCTYGVKHQWSTYHRARTEVAFKNMREASCCGSATKHYKFTYFNDPQLRAKYSDMSYASGHDNHLHVRYCQSSYPYHPDYRC